MLGTSRTDGVGEGADDEQDEAERHSSEEEHWNRQKGRIAFVESVEQFHQAEEVWPVVAALAVREPIRPALASRS